MEAPITFIFIDGSRVEMPGEDADVLLTHCGALRETREDDEVMVPSLTSVRITEDVLRRFLGLAKLVGPEKYRPNGGPELTDAVKAEMLKIAADKDDCDFVIEASNLLDMPVLWTALAAAMAAKVNDVPSGDKKALFNVLVELGFGAELIAHKEDDDDQMDEEEEEEEEEEV